MDAANKDFAVLAKESKLVVNPSVRVKAIDENFGSVANQRQIVKWAFSGDTKVGDVKRFEVLNVGHIIAKLKKVTEKGLMAVEDARPQVEQILKNKKKAEKIKTKLSGSSLDAMAKANNVTVQQAIDITLESPSLPGAGFEPKVVGTAFSSATGKVSATIEGNAGVYVVMTKSVLKAPVLKSHTDYVNKVKQQVASYSGRVIPALKSDADIQDNRADFY
jgi:peptidyl-prolyl cis-trans isomerase D